MMSDYYLEEDAAGNILIVDKTGEELTRFWGKTAFEDAIRYAQENDLRLRANISPSDLFEPQQIYRRRSRLLRFNYPQNELPTFSIDTTSDELPTLSIADDDDWLDDSFAHPFDGPQA